MHRQMFAARRRHALPLRADRCGLRPVFFVRTRLAFSDLKSRSRCVTGIGNPHKGRTAACAVEALRASVPCVLPIAVKRFNWCMRVASQLGGRWIARLAAAKPYLCLRRLAQPAGTLATSLQHHEVLPQPCNGADCRLPPERTRACRRNALAANGSEGQVAQAGPCC